MYCPQVLSQIREGGDSVPENPEGGEGLLGCENTPEDMTHQEEKVRNVTSCLRRIYACHNHNRES